MMVGPVATLDPIGILGQRAAWPNWAMHETLFHNEDGTLPPTSLLATDYSLSEDYLTYTFTLKEGVTFHDGSELTAPDVVYSWRRLAESDNGRGEANLVVGNVMNIAHEETEDEEVIPDTMELEATGDYTVEMTLATPFHSTIGHLTTLNLAIVPEGIVGDIEGYDGEMAYEEWATTDVSGTGPFQLENWSSGSEVVVSAFEDYHGTVATLDGVRWQIVEDSSAQYTRAVNEQNADIFTIPRSQFDPSLLELGEELEGNRQLGTYGPVGGSTLNYGQATLPRTQYLIFNTLAVEKPARQAMAYMLNQQVLTEEATRGLGQPAYFLTPPNSFPGGPGEYDRIAQQDYPYGYNTSDLESARQVMSDAGYGSDNPYETSISVPSDSRASQWQSITSLMTDLAQSVYIDLSVETAPHSTLTNRAIESNFDIFGTYNELSWMEADSTLQFAYPNPFTWTNWGQGDAGMSAAAQDAADAWSRYEENRVPTDAAQEVRNDVYLTIERANWEDVTELPLWHPTDQQYWWDWVQNYQSYGPLGRPRLNEIGLGDRA